MERTRDEAARMEEGESPVFEKRKGEDGEAGLYGGNRRRRSSGSGSGSGGGGGDGEGKGPVGLGISGIGESW